MRPFLILATALFSMHAAAGPFDVSAPASVQTIAALGPAAQKVYPPLPTLAMLPPSSGEEDDAPAKSASKKAKKTRRVADCKCNGPEPRLVVSDESRTYMKDVERRIDIALAP
ncbi:MULTISPECIES: hypothetical protein [Caballeronia]|uniref:Signal peptide protein n=2 Tax=Caballeronia TaxID=1827195 RepID=A0A656QA97_9BURK|nr:MULTISPECIES: hypothetical protein [Caballeronia]EKS67916.1 putative signal peptide protein [Burkholderia sp. SJ98]KDR24893.1 signal peptide protein [Caballeronia zhejiangensis]